MPGARITPSITAFQLIASDLRRVIRKLRRTRRNRGAVFTRLPFGLAPAFFTAVRSSGDDTPNAATKTRKEYLPMCGVVVLPLGCKLLNHNLRDIRDTGPANGKGASRTVSNWRKRLANSVTRFKVRRGMAPQRKAPAMKSDTTCVSETGLSRNLKVSENGRGNCATRKASEEMRRASTESTISPFFAGLG